MRKILIVGVAAFGVAASNAAFGQSAPQAGPPDVTATTCRDLLSAPGDEEENILVFFHGYVSGKREEVKVDIEAFSQASAEIVQACIDDPAAKLLDVFTAKR